MPFGSYQVSEDAAVTNAIRFVKEGGADAVKLEGAGRTLTRISGIVEAGIPVMGHIGLTPQSATKLGGYRAQGRTAAAAKRLVDEAVGLEGVPLGGPSGSGWLVACVPVAWSTITIGPQSDTPHNRPASRSQSFVVSSK